MATLNDINIASRDQDLRERFAAAAAEAGVMSPENWVADRARALVSQVMLPPGLNPAAVIDAHLRSAVAQVLAQEPQ